MGTRTPFAALTLGLLLGASGPHGDTPTPPAAPKIEQPQAAAKPQAAPARTAPRAARPSSPSTVDVSVLDNAGRPVEGALVTALPTVGAYDGLQVRSALVRNAISDKGGRARLERMPPGPWSVSVDARGFAPAHESRFSGATLTIRLDRGATLTGVVRDGTTKAPVAGARVALAPGMPLAADWAEKVARSEAVTDARGAFRLDGVGRGLLSVAARARGYGPATRSGARAGTPVELFLFPGPTLSGTVRDDAGKPVPGASVRLFGQGWSTPPPVDPTDAAGRFAAVGVPPGEYWIVARAGGRAPGLAQVVLAERDDATVDVTLGDGGYVTGRTVDDAGKPIADASVRPEAFASRGLPQLVCDSLAVVSRADGSFALGPVPAGSLSLAFSHRGHAPARTAVTVATMQSADLRDVVLESGLAIRGQVRDRDGAPIAGVLVRAQPRHGEEPRTEAETDAEGGFVLSGLTAGAYTLTAQAAGYAHRFTTATAGGDPVAIVLDAGATIVGRVVDASLHPVDSATVSGETDEGPQIERPFLHAMVGEEGEGRFTIRDAAPATYALKVVAAGAGRGSLTGVKAIAGRTTDVGTIALGAAGVVTGVVVDADGQGVAGATVQVRPDAHSMSSEDPSAQTDTNGAFEARGVRPGRVDVVAMHPSFVASKPTRVDVDPEKEPQPVRIVLVRGGRLEGRARHRDGRPFDDGRVMVSPLGTGGSASEPTPTLPDGSFVVEHVPPGRVSAALLTRVASHPSMSGPPGMTILAGVASRELEVREGETASVDFVTREVVVAGRVTRGGQGMGGVVVSVMSQDGGAMSGYMGMSPTVLAPPSGPPPLTATTREDGSYELLVFAPGKSYVQMRSPERQAFPGREVDIPDVERYELDLDVGAVSVSGTVVDSDSGAPIPEVQVRLREPGADGATKGGAASGADGRFTIAAEAGDYVLDASGAGRRPAKLPVSVGSAGLADVRVEMEPGAEIRGRAVDAAGRPVPDADVIAVDAAGETTPFGERSLPDGTFRLSGLDSRPYAVLAGQERVGFAVRANVTPGGEAVTLALRPGARVVVRVVGPDGAPVKDAWPRVSAWDGIRTRYVPGQDTRPTEVPGTYELVVPRGSLEITARRPQLSGSASVQASADRTSTVEIVLRETKPRR